MYVSGVSDANKGISLRARICAVVFAANVDFLQNNIRRTRRMQCSLVELINVVNNLVNRDSKTRELNSPDFQIIQPKFASFGDICIDENCKVSLR